MDLLSQNPQISSDPGTKGFDLSAGKTWIYPENYPIRDYQLDIVRASLYSNTMVCLPTGLGKTFIAAVVMYNFWRWYPRGKVVFLAPTRPLVAQQIYACHNTMGIPSTETIELTGAVNKKQREISWRARRVIFATPQVFHNDLQSNIVPGELIKCVVIDEAHKALGKHSYCECIRLLCKTNSCFRVLALSATPGNKIDNVHEVIKNLCIAHVELRDETSPDVVPYINQRKIDIIVVPLSDELAKHKDRYIHIMDRHVRVLLRYKVLQGDAGDISKGWIFHLMTTFQKKTEKSENYGQIMKTLNILMTMYHAYELLVRDGLRAFYKFYQNHSEKFWMKDEIQLQELLEEIGTYLGPFPDVKLIRDNSTLDIPKNLVFGHPKFEKLQEILLRHFNVNGKVQSDTRAIIFVEYRDIVSEIFILLLRSRPLIRPQMFVGQAGQKQKQQIQALESFRKNDVNVLISTSIGEEGLDVGEVDLIICFDISQHSPTRLVQRMGRTGRKRDGHIIILVTDGREHQTLKSTMARRDSINLKICNTKNISSSLYENNPRMIPDIFEPECYKMHINVQLKSPVSKRDKKGKSKKGKGKREGKASDVVAESSDLQPKYVAQRSVRKFFQSEAYDGSSDSDFKIASRNEKSANARNVTKTSDVKILAEDNEAIDFLTICALRRSERETNDGRENNVSVPNNPPVPPAKHFFHFSIPNVQILDCLFTLRDAAVEKVEGNVSKVDWKERKVSGVKEELLDNRKSEMSSEGFVEASKFEDLLDDSSNSTCGSVRSEGYGEEYGEGKPLTGAGTANESVATLGPFTPRLRGTDFSKASTRLQNMSLELLEPGTFEDILDESSDSMEFDDGFENMKYEGGTAMAHKMNIDLKSLKIPETGRSLSKSAIEKENNGAMLGVTRTIDEIMHSSSKVQERETEEESENDMFWEEATKSPDVDWTPGNVESVKEKDSRTNVSELDIGNVSFQEDDFDLDFGDWETHDRPVTSEDKRDSESERWISTEKSYRKRDNARRTSIAKKLAASKRQTMGRKTESRCVSKKRSDDLDDSREDDVAVTNTECPKVSEQSNESRFFGKSKPSSSSDDLEVTFAVPKDSGKFRSAVHRGKAIGESGYGKTAKRSRNEFICDEAERPPDDSTDESSVDGDRDLSGFVSYTQDVHDSTDMQLHYLRSVNSPGKRPGTFFFRERPAVDSTLDVYSQMPSQANETYLYDSFCVPLDYVSDGDKENETSTRLEDMSVLERAERILELKKKRKRCRAATEYADSESCYARRKRKRRKERSNDEVSSSEDEIEKLRAQIQNESSLLARNSQRT